MMAEIYNGHDLYNQYQGELFLAYALWILFLGLIFGLFLYFLNKGGKDE